MTLGVFGRNGALCAPLDRARGLCVAALVVSLSGCGDGAGTGESAGGSAGAGSSSVGGAGAAGSGGAGAGGAELPDCIRAIATDAGDAFSEPPYETTVSIDDPESCARTYVLTTDAPLRDDLPDNPRTVTELASQPVLRTGHAMFDALYALALEEVRECSVDAIVDASFNDGQPTSCPDGGCFETGRLWTYVWTRDTAYSVALGLGMLDPIRSRNSLAFKTSLKRDGTDLQIVQDTGSGGSYPISTDRATWALGAREALKFLDGEEREAFRDLAYEAIVNTAEHDREVIWDSRDGLYTGEQSFLDWREQSYAGFTSTNTVHIGMSKALSTNVAHLLMLQTARDLAVELGDAAGEEKFGGWATALQSAIRNRFYLPDAQLLSTFVPTYLDEAPVQRFDLLGSALAVSAGVMTEVEAQAIVQNYPVLPKGPPVIWPQQQDVAIYHNRGLWPFVTAYWANAARQVGNGQAVSHAAKSLYRGAALNLSNMENFEAVTGANWLEEGATSGPVVNSQRQLWSVAGYVSMVHSVLFGMDATQSGIRFAPFIPGELRAEFFDGSETIALSNLNYRGRKISVQLRLPDGPFDGSLIATSVTMNGIDVGLGYIEADDVPPEAYFEVELEADGRAGSINLIEDVADHRNIFGPRTPVITDVGIAGGLVGVDLSIGNEISADVTINVYRDGAKVGADLPGTTSSWQDPTSQGHASTSYCYVIETVFASGNASQHSEPHCYWGPGFDRVQTWDALSFANVGGSLVNNYGYWHYEDWGDEADTLTLDNVTVDASGEYLVQLLAGNGAGGFTTGITCAVKTVEVWDGPTLVASDPLMMPHLGTWDAWRDSSFMPVLLEAGTSYTIVIRQSGRSHNMSVFEHFATYGGQGGTAGSFNRVNVAEIKLLQREL